MCVYICRYEHEYDLILNPDFNTRGHTQWYYFSVRNTRKDVRYRFNIINLVKGDSLYNYGMRPLVYSDKLAAEKRIGWHRAGEEMCYYQNHIKRRNTFYYTFTFSFASEYDHDTLYFAYCYPLSYTDLQVYVGGTLSLIDVFCFASMDRLCRWRAAVTNRWSLFCMYGWLECLVSPSQVFERSGG